MCIKPKAIMLLLVGILFASSVSASVNVFADLDDIAKDKRISFRTAKQEIQELIEGIADPIRIKSIILRSSDRAKLCYTCEQKDIYERYDEAIFLGMCRLVQMNTAESIRQLVDLISYDLGVSNNEILGQRITEIGGPALLHMKTKLRELRKKEKTGNQESKQSASKKIRLIEGYINYIKKGKKIDAGVGPCFTRGKD